MSQFGEDFLLGFLGSGKYESMKENERKQAFSGKLKEFATNVAGDRYAGDTKRLSADILNAMADGGYDPQQVGMMKDILDEARAIEAAKSRSTVIRGQGTPALPPSDDFGDAFKDVPIDGAPASPDYQPPAADTKDFLAGIAGSGQAWNESDFMASDRLFPVSDPDKAAKQKFEEEQFNYLKQKNALSLEVEKKKAEAAMTEAEAKRLKAIQKGVGGGSSGTAKNAPGPTGLNTSELNKLTELAAAEKSQAPQQADVTLDEVSSPNAKRGAAAPAIDPIDSAILTVLPDMDSTTVYKNASAAIGTGRQSVPEGRGLPGAGVIGDQERKQNARIARDLRDGIAYNPTSQEAFVNGKLNVGSTAGSELLKSLNQEELKTAYSRGVTLRTIFDYLKKSQQRPAYNGPLRGQ
jgi:hypothetical protein